MTSALVDSFQQYAEADPTQTTRILDAMHRFVDLVHTIWTTGQQGDPSMGFQFDYQFVRWEEVRALCTPACVVLIPALSSYMPSNGFMIMTLEVTLTPFMARLHLPIYWPPLLSGKESMLLETMQLVRDTGFSWKDNWFTDAIFPKTAVTHLNMQTYANHHIALHP